MGTSTAQALRTEFDLEEEEERFFLDGVEKAGSSRNTYEHHLRRRKILVGLAIGIGSLALVALIIGLAWGLGHRKIKYKCPRSYLAGQGDVFYVVGDWGRQGNDNQQQVARLMAEVSGCMPPSFIISTGDNFYPSGLSSATDPQFTQSFSAVYTAPGLQVPWYAVMGNHDYGDNVDTSLLSSGQCLRAPTSEDQCANTCCFSPLWQTAPELQKRDWRWNATLGGVVTRTIPLAGGSANLDIVLMDTVPCIWQYQSRPWAGFLRGFNSTSCEAVQQQLQQQLNASAASGSRWRLVVGHHPVRSYGSHCRPAQTEADDCQDMAFMRPLLQKYRVAAYINGHDHDQQLIKSPDDPVYYVVSGAGSNVRQEEFDNVESTDALFLSSTPGFLAVVLTGDNMRLYFHTVGQSEPTYTRTVPVPS